MIKTSDIKAVKAFTYDSGIGILEANDEKITFITFCGNKYGKKCKSKVRYSTKGIYFIGCNARQYLNDFIVF